MTKMFGHHSQEKYKSPTCTPPEPGPQRDKTENLSSKNQLISKANLEELQRMFANQNEEAEPPSPSSPVTLNLNKTQVVATTNTFNSL